MSVHRVVIRRDIAASVEEVFTWFYQSEHFIASPIVFVSTWKTPSRWTKGAQRDIIMIAGWYREEITDVQVNKSIRYRVLRSVPPIRQEFTELAVESIGPQQTSVTWTIELEVVTPIGKRLLNRLAGQMAKLLYATILKAGKDALEES